MLAVFWCGVGVWGGGWDGEGFEETEGKAPLPLAGPLPLSPSLAHLADGLRHVANGSVRAVRAPDLRRAVEVDLVALEGEAAVLCASHHCEAVALVGRKVRVVPLLLLAAQRVDLAGDVADRAFNLVFGGWGVGWWYGD